MTKKGSTRRPRAKAAKRGQAGRSKARRQEDRARSTEARFLGNARAVRIVCSCAGTIPANLSRTLSELGVAGGPFQACVFDAVSKAKFRITLDDIPNSGDTMLVTVVNVIQ